MNFQIDFLTTKISQQLTGHLSYNSNIIASDNVYRRSSHLYCKSITKEIV